MGKAELNPLKKWVLTNKFFIKTTDTKEKKATATHFLLDGGIWSIPKERYSEFLNLLAIDLQNNEKHYICENRTDVFKFICDIDMFENEIITIEQISNVVKILNDIVTIYYGENKVIICGADSKTVKINETEMVKSGFHLVWPDIWISVENAKKIRLLFIEELISKFGERESCNKWEDVVDLAVYEDNGLRMVGCRKMAICKSCKNKKDFRETCESCEGTGKKDENRIYSPKAVLGPCEQSYFGSILSYYVMLPETSIYNYRGVQQTELLKEFTVVLKEKKKKSVKGGTDDEVTIKIEAFIKRNYKQTHPKIKINKLTKNENCYYAEPDDNFCINVNRNHSSSGVYFQITPNGVCQRCYCKKETLENRSNGMCKHFASPEIPLTKVLQTLLFGVKMSKNSKKIVNMNITRNSSNSSLDLSISSHQNHKEFITVNKETCLMNCKNILFQIENEILKK
jgi:hypothetical protein